MKKLPKFMRKRGAEGSMKEEMSESMGEASNEGDKPMKGKKRGYLGGGEILPTLTPQRRIGVITGRNPLVLSRQQRANNQAARGAQGLNANMPYRDYPKVGGPQIKATAR